MPPRSVQKSRVLQPPPGSSHFSSGRWSTFFPGAGVVICFRQGLLQLVRGWGWRRRSLPSLRRFSPSSCPTCAGKGRRRSQLAAAVVFVVSRGGFHLLAAERLLVRRGSLALCLGRRVQQEDLQRLLLPSARISCWSASCGEFFFVLLRRAEPQQRRESALKWKRKVSCNSRMTILPDI